jgi:hypothetical protein
MYRDRGLGQTIDRIWAPASERECLCCGELRLAFVKLPALSCFAVRSTAVREEPLSCSHCGANLTTQSAQTG